MDRERYLKLIQNPCAFARGTLELSIRVTRETMHAVSARLAAVLARGAMQKPVLQREDPTGDYFLVDLRPPEIRHIVEVLERLRDAGILHAEILGRVIAQWRRCLHQTETQQFSNQ